jgi:pyridoxal phosphate enzyme (YggS family)
VLDAARVADHVAAIRQRIEQLGGRDVALLAVTKTFGAEAAAAAVAAGCDGIGENYAQELLAKAPALAVLASGAPIHFIGHLQSNKVRALAPIVSLWETLDRVSIVDEVAARSPQATVMIQVNVSGEASKSGCRPPDTASLVAHARDRGLAVVGLMTIGRAGDASAAEQGFRELRRLADELALPRCSMGMSDDFEIAVAEGATEVRIGSALFGPRVRG